MITHRRRTSLLLVILCLVVWGPVPGQGAGAGQNDAGSGRDASDTSGGAFELKTGRHQGRLVSGTDRVDWYYFKIDSIPGLSGRPVVELALVDVPSPMGYILELWKDPATTVQPSLRAAGPSGVRTIHTSIQQNGTWHLRVLIADGNAAGNTGSYELTFEKRYENDADRSKDAGSGIDADYNLLPEIPSSGLVLEGEMAPRDPVDNYRLNLPAGTGNHEILAGLHFSPTLSLGLELEQVAPIVLITSGRTGPGFATVFNDNAQGSWIVRVKNTEPQFGGRYSLAVRIDPPEGDPGSGTDAPAAFEGANPLPQGVHTGSLTPTSLADKVDVFRLEGVGVGKVIAVGASSFLPDTTPNRPLLDLHLYDPDLVERDQVRICGQAGGIVRTAHKDGTWYLQVSEVGGTGEACAPGPLVRDNRYAVSYALRTQPDGPSGDAPAGTPNAPTVPNTLWHEGWSDEGDVDDTYRLDPAPVGGVFRVAASSPVESMDFTIRLFNSAGQVLASNASVAGRARLQIAVGAEGTYFLRFEQSVTSSNPAAAGPYIFYARSLPNEAPIPVRLSNPDESVLANEVTRNSVKVRWTRSVDEDFQKYEVYAAQNPNFLPSPSLLRATITDRDQTDTTVTGLEAGREYTLLVRVYDGSGLFADSNRETVQLKSGPLSNSNPSLSGGGVSPPEGTTSTLFTFHVNYTDADNDPPTQRQVFIDGIASHMTSPDTVYNDGAHYTFQTTLAAGQHSFYFEFSDGTASPVREPTTGSHTGPTVSAQGNRPPTASASASPSQGDAPLTVQFDVVASDPDGDPLTYSWDFDNSDGIQDQASQKSPQYTYEDRGVYTATVRVRDSKGATSTSSVTVNVAGPANEPPTVTAEASPESGLAPLSVQFFANASDTDGTIVSYGWDFDNSDGIGADSTQANPTHAYADPGSYVATVRVRDNGSAEAVDSVLVVVRSADNVPPSIVVAADPLSGEAPLEVFFTADTSDADGDAVTVRWDFDVSDGIQTDATGENAQHTYAAAGRFTAMGVATDARGATATASVTIHVAQPSASGTLVVEATPKEGPAPLIVRFRADTSNLPNPVASYRWDFGDESGFGTNRSVEHTYHEDGTYLVTLTVTDDRGVEYESTVSIKVGSGGGSPGFGVGLVALAVLGAAAALWRRRR